MEIIPVMTPQDLEQTRLLFREYEAFLGLDLSFQGFENELANLPGQYAPPEGRLFIAKNGHGDSAGCIAYKRLEPDICEMKRLFVRPTFRGENLGRKLSLYLIAEATQAGYQAMRLDTLPMLKSAIALYESLGFQKIEPYYNNPVPGAVFMELELQEAGNF